MQNADGSDFYNERGPTWYVFPARVVEEYGSRHTYFVAEVDNFDEQNRTGHWLCECGSMKEAQAIVRACNSYEADQAELSRLRAEREELLGALKDALPILEHLDSVREEDEAPCSVVSNARRLIQKAQEGSK